MKILSPAISRLARLRYWNIEQWLLNPVDAQREVLQDLVTHAQHTEIGRKYNFHELFTIRSFKQSVPIHEYDDLKPYIERLMGGEQNLLWDTPVYWFAKSSGTTSDKSKFIPVTEESFEDCHYQAAKDVLTLYYQYNPESDLLTGKGLVIGGSHQINAINEESHYGDLSAVLLQNTPFWSTWIRTPDLSIALMDEWESKIESLAQTTIQENVTSISGVPTWTLVLIKRILEITAKAILRKCGQILNYIFMVVYRLRPIKNNLKNSWERMFNILKCTMPVKVFLQPRIIHMRKAWYCIYSTEYFMSSCLWKNMASHNRVLSVCKKWKQEKIMLW